MRLMILNKSSISYHFNTVLANSVCIKSEQYIECISLLKDLKLFKNLKVYNIL